MSTRAERKAKLRQQSYARLKGKYKGASNGWLRFNSRKRADVLLAMERKK